MFVLKKFETPGEVLSFQEIRDLAWSIANPDICFNVSKCITIDGVVDSDVLATAIIEVASRHESLRTSFVETGKHAFRRIIHDKPRFELEMADMRSTPAEHGDVALALRSFTEQRFDIEAFPLFRVLKVDVSDHRTVLAFSMAHVISDAASTDIFAGGVGKTYASLIQGGHVPLPPPEYQLSDFVQSHREWMQSGDYEGKLQALRTRLLPGIEGTQPDLGACGVPQQKARKAAQLRHLHPAGAARELDGIARAHKVTAPAALLAISALALSRLMDRKQFFFSFMLSNRHYAGLNSVIGHVANAVPVFVDAQRGTVGSFLSAINRDFYLSASGVGIIPLGIVNQAVAGLDPVLSVKSPLNQLMINIATSTQTAGEFAGMRAQGYRNPYAGFISNALQMNFTVMDIGILQQCRCPEEHVGLFEQRAPQTLDEAMAYVSRYPDAPLADFVGFTLSP